MKGRRSGAAAAALTAILLASCQSLGNRETPDQRAIARGVTAWNEREPAAARPYWSAVKEASQRDRYLSYVDSYEAGARALSEAAAPADETRRLAAYEKARASFGALPGELPVPPQAREQASEVAAGRVRALIAANRLPAARDLGQKALAAFGESQAISSMLAEIDVMLASRRREAQADSSLDKARAVEAFDDRIAAQDAAIAVYAGAEAALAQDAGRAGVARAPGVAGDASRLRKKRQDAAVERDGLLRERAYAYRERIGEEFARAPEGKQAGSMTLEEVLAHQESVKAGVEAAYREVKAFAERYPRSVDEEFLAAVEEQKKDLDAKIAQINAEIRTAREIASRGKIVVPVMIGLFNAQPGSGDDGKKSRPATFGSRASKADYWWGMVSIAPGAMNDLVVTVNDERTVRVFRENTKSGSLVGRNGIKDLVNRGYKVGNSWPVLNAGSQLAGDKYFFEVQPGRTPDYAGEVVVYSSFIMRTR